MARDLIRDVCELEHETAGRNEVDPDAHYEAESDLRQFQGNMEELQADGKGFLPDFSFVPIVDPSTLNIDLALKAADQNYLRAERGWRELMNHSNNNNTYIRNRRNIKALQTQIANIKKQSSRQTMARLTASG